MFDEAILDLLKADILAQMRDTAVKRLNKKGYQVLDSNVESSSPFVSRQSLVIDTDLLSEIKTGELRREFSNIGKEIKGESNA